MSLTTKHGVILQDTPADSPCIYECSKALLEKNSKENAFFEVCDHKKILHLLRFHSGAGAQSSNAQLGMAYANSLK